jgi:hypothetical protein
MRLKGNSITHLLGSTNRVGLILAVLFLWLLSWTGDQILALYLSMEMVQNNQWATHAAVVLLFFAVFTVLLLIKPSSPDDKITAEGPIVDLTKKRIKKLIFPLSNFSTGNADESIKYCIEQISDQYPFNLTRAEPNNIRNNWQMPLCAIDPHKNTLNEIIVLTSSGEKGSANQIDSFKSIVEKVFGATLANKLTFKACDFNDFDEIYTMTIQEFKNCKGLANSEVLIDITGGNKIVSLALSSAALSKGRLIQYVEYQSDKPTPAEQYDVKGYSLEVNE